MWVIQEGAGSALRGLGSVFHSWTSSLGFSSSVASDPQQKDLQTKRLLPVCKDSHFLRRQSLLTSHRDSRLKSVISTAGLVTAYVIRDGIEIFFF